MMAVLAAGALTVDGVELDAMNGAVARCDRVTVARGVEAEGGRHTAFLLDGFREQSAIATARADLAARRRALRTPGQGRPADSEAGIALAYQALEDRQQSLDDLRTLDRLRQEAVANLRQGFLSRCQGKAG